MSDNGAAMTATEITEGLARLGILHQTTLPYSPYMNGKQEVLCLASRNSVRRKMTVWSNGRAAACLRASTR